MNHAGLTLNAIVALAILFVALVGLIGYYMKSINGKPRGRMFTVICGLAAVALVGIGTVVALAPQSQVYSTSGKVVSVETHGDGNKSTDYSVIDTDTTNVALVVLRKDLPSVKEGDQVHLSCTKPYDKDVYSCTPSGD